MPSTLNPLGATHGPSVSRFLNKNVSGHGGWSVQSTHEGVIVHVNPYAEANVLLALGRGGYVYTTHRSKTSGTRIKVTHRKT